MPNLYVISGCNGAGKTTSEHKPLFIADGKFGQEITIFDKEKFEILI